MSDMLRITGMVTGLDTDEMVKKLLSAEQLKIDRVKQEKQYAEWKQEAYREISNLLREFKDEYFDFLKPESNFRSSATFNVNAVLYSSSDITHYLDVTPSADAAEGSYTISNIVAATSAEATSSAAITTDVVGNTLTAPVTIDSSNDQFYVTLNGAKQEVSISPGTYDTPADFQSELQSQLDRVFGPGKITVALAGTSSDQIEFTTDTTNTLSISEYSGDNALQAMSFTSSTNLSNKISLSADLADIKNHFATPLSAAGTQDDISFTINDTAFTFSSATTSLQEIMDEVNTSDAGVTMRYDELTDKMVVRSKDTGVTSQVQISDTTGNLMSSLGLSGASSAGTDASIGYDDGSGVVTVTRSSNSFTVNGLTIELKQDYSGSLGFSVGTDTTEVVDLIKGFVEKYNDLISKIHDKLTEKRLYDYRPLTDAQKEEMSDREIELWEDKAKSGLLRSDPILERIVNNMRTALYETVQGVDVNLFDLGITTSRNYTDGGKLIIDETKLESAIRDNSHSISQLFTKNGDTYDSKGLSHRLYDIIEDNIRVTGDENGRKGILLEKAGIEGDVTDFKNQISNQIDAYNERIDAFLDELSRKEDRYYQMFAKMEAAIARMNNQSSWLMLQMGMGGGTM